VPVPSARPTVPVSSARPTVPLPMTDVPPAALFSDARAPADDDHHHDHHDHRPAVLAAIIALLAVCGGALTVLTLALS
jgi:hypothetical protein